MLAAILVLAAAPAEAQRPIEFVGGVTFSKPSGDDVSDVDTKSGIFFAVGLPFMVSPAVTVTPYLSYIQRGWKEDDQTVSFAYLDVPVFFGIGFPLGTSAGLSIGAGPKLAIRLSCEQEMTDSGETADCNDVGNEIKGTDFGVIGGAGIGFQVSPTVGIGAGGAADASLTDFSDIYAAKHRTFYLFASVSIVLGGA
jgi:hypothetical protein